MLLRGLIQRDREAERLTFALRPTAIMVIAIVLFGLFIRGGEFWFLTTPRLGLMVVGPVAVFVVGHGDARCDVRKSLLVLAFGLTAASMLVFPDLLGVPIPVFPEAIVRMPSRRRSASTRRCGSPTSPTAAWPRRPVRRLLRASGDAPWLNFSTISILGFSVVLSVQNILLCLVGCLVGTLIGVLPGIGPLATIAILMPITYNAEPIGALIMLAGIYYGSQYGGSTTAILVNMPGESSSVVTTLDGHAMARQGRAGKALGIAAIGSFIAGTFATLVIAAIAMPLSKLALSFTAGNYFALMVLGLSLAIVLAGGSVLKAFCMLIIGVIMAMVGADQITAQPRLTFGISHALRRLRHRHRRHGPVRHRRDPAQSREPRAAAVRRRCGRAPAARLERHARVRRRDRAAARCSAPSSASSRATARRLSSFASYVLEKRVATPPRAVRQGRDPGRGGAGIRQQRRRADDLHAAADAWACLRRRPWRWSAAR